MRKIAFLLNALLLAFTANSQTIGGPCEGCEAVLEYGAKRLNSIDTLPGFSTNEPKMIIQGTVYQPDGKTPAAGVIIYAYHTNQEGIYPTKGDEKGWARRHGYIRGWAKTDAHGKYAFYTFKPGSYPSRTDPAHVHLTVKEPDKNEYYIDSIHFDDDPLLTEKIRNWRSPRGGSGIVKLEEDDGYLIANRDIVLGLNIPNYR